VGLKLAHDKNLHHSYLDPVDGPRNPDFVICQAYQITPAELQHRQKNRPRKCHMVEVSDHLTVAGPPQVRDGMGPLLLVGVGEVMA